MDIAELLRNVSAKQKALQKAKSLYQHRLAPDFNPFDFIKRSEMSLSSVIGWMLDPTASHGQGATFLKALLDQINLAWPIAFHSGASVHLESSIAEGRIDILVKCADRALIIENKPWASDQDQQIFRYFSYLDRHKIDIDAARLVYLTPNGAMPSEKSIELSLRQERLDAEQLTCWGYESHFIEWLKACRAACHADRVTVFLDEFSRFVTKEFGGARDMVDAKYLIDEVTRSSDSITAAMEIIASASIIRTSLFAKMKSDLLQMTQFEGWKLDWHLVDGKKWDRFEIVLPNRPSGLVFQFDLNECNSFWFGSRAQKNRTADLKAHEVMTQFLGSGKAHADWSWWRHSSAQDSLMPFDSNWGKSPAPWVAIANGQMRDSIHNTARCYQTAMNSLDSTPDLSPTSRA